jgi:hypothetical protein
MASKPDTGPDAADRDDPGGNQTNPTGVSAETPAEGDDDAPGKDDGSPQG